MSRPGGVRRPEWIAAAPGAGAWIAFRPGTGIVLEDALLTFRFAENLASGRGFPFPAGEPVLGTTTPLITRIHAGLRSRSTQRAPIRDGGGGSAALTFDERRTSRGEGAR